MAKVEFDPELMRNIKIIYGDADLDERTLRLLHLTWATNPDIIRRTALLKMPKLQEAYFDAPEMSSLPTRLEPLPATEIALDDLRGVKDFKTAFRVARERGLKQFMWGDSVYSTELRKLPTVLIPLTSIQNNVEIPNLIATTKGATFGDGIPTIIERRQLPSNKETKQQNGIRLEYPTLLFGPVFPTKQKQKQEQKVYDSVVAEVLSFLDDKLKNMRIPNYNMGNVNDMYDISMKQQGGKMNNQQELQKAFVAYLIQDALKQGVQIQSEQDLQSYAELLGEDGIKAKYQEFMLKMQGGVMARLGAKLEYYKKLKGTCPEGEELVYFKQGGRICKVCQKARTGTKVTKKVNEVDKFKAGRALYKKDMKSAKDLATKDSISINKYNDLETMANSGNKGKFVNGTWVPDRQLYVKKNACGTKMKK